MNTGQDLWKHTALLLAGGAMGTLISAMTGLTRQDVERLVNEGPWTKDRPGVERRINTVETGYADIKAELNSVGRELVRLGVKLDTILEQTR